MVNRFQITRRNIGATQAIHHEFHRRWGTVDREVANTAPLIGPGMVFVAIPAVSMATYRQRTYRAAPHRQRTAVFNVTKISGRREAALPPPYYQHQLQTEGDRGYGNQRQDYVLSW